MDVYVARPFSGWGPFPIVLLAHRFDGLSDYTRMKADQLAEGGYVAVAPDMFHRCPKTLTLPQKGDTLEDKNIIADLTAARDLAKQQPDVAADSIGVLGHCMGGRMSFLAAATIPGITACVVYYSGKMFVAKPEGGPPPFERLKSIKCPVIGFFGKLDKNPSPEDVAKIDAELTRHAVPHRFISFEGAGHGFQSTDDPAKTQEWAAAQSWNQTMSFLRRHLHNHWRHVA
jgi:carboxymethylenebutenolidase